MTSPNRGNGSSYERPGLKFLTGTANEKTGAQAKRQEKSAAKTLGGRTTVGSGNKGMKGDVWAGNLMVECKSTDKRSISLKLDWLEKLVREAFQKGREAVLLLRWDANTTLPPGDWAVIPFARLAALYEAEEELKALKA